MPENLIHSKPSPSMALGNQVSKILITELISSPGGINLGHKEYLHNYIDI